MRNESSDFLGWTQTPTEHCWITPSQHRKAVISLVSATDFHTHSTHEKREPTWGRNSQLYAWLKELYMVKGTVCRQTHLQVGKNQRRKHTPSESGNKSCPRALKTDTTFANAMHTSTMTAATKPSVFNIRTNNNSNSETDTGADTQS